MKLDTMGDLQAWADGVDSRLVTLGTAVKASFMAEVVGTKHQQQVESIGKMFKLIAGRNDTELKEMGIVRGSVDTYDVKADLGDPLTGDSVTGSYLVPQQYLSEIMRIADVGSDLIPKVRRIKMDTRVALAPKTDDVIDFVYVSGQTDDLTEVSPTFGQETLTAATFAMYLGVSEAFLEDNLANFGQYISELTGEAWVRLFETQLLAGSGSPTTGVLSDTGVNTVTMDAGRTSFESIESDDLLDMIKALTTRAKRRGSFFIGHPTVLDLIAALKNANGDYVFRTAADNLSSTLHGYPILRSDNMPDSGDSAEDTAFLIFGNPKNLAWGDRISLEVRFFNQTMYAMKNCEAFFRCRVRAAFNVVHPEAFALLKTAAS